MIGSRTRSCIRMPTRSFLSRLLLSLVTASLVLGKQRVACRGSPRYLSRPELGFFKGRHDRHRLGLRPQEARSAPRRGPRGQRRVIRQDRPACGRCCRTAWPCARRGVAGRTELRAWRAPEQLATCFRGRRYVALLWKALEATMLDSPNLTQHAMYNHGHHDQGGKVPLRP